MAASVPPSSAATATVWDRLAQCESSGDFTNRDTGRNGHFGGFQFAPATWASVGGRGNPADASVTEQLKRAKILLARSGPGQWECKVGLTRANGAAQGLTVLGSPRTSATRASQKASAASLRAVAFAKAQLGKPYVFGAEGPFSFDCSGLTQAAWKAAGVSIPRTSQAQAAGIPVVAFSAIRAGDLVIYRDGSGLSRGHVAIYIGAGKIIEAPRPGRTVRTADVRKGWYADHFQFVVRPGARSLSPGLENLLAGDPGTASASRAPSPTPRAKPDPVLPVNRTHTVVRGETLDAIARGAAIKGGWPELYRANRAVVGGDPDRIFPGQRLRLPG
jgi:cell wall-associated NlpC family hydrolase